MRAHKHLHEHHHGHSCGHDHSHDHNDCGHNHGLIGQMAHNFSTKAAVVNESIGNVFGGRSNSGRIGRATRIVRGISNSSAVGIGIAGVVAVGTSVASGGLAAPLWILIGGGVAVAANLAAVGIGSGVNHLKISQYYDALVEVNAENSRVLKLMGENPETLPHGIMEYWEKDRKLFKMTVKRRSQEAVSVAGTAMSGALMLSAVGAFAIAPPAALGLFFAARGISCTTTAGSAYNTKDRLTIYKEILYKFGQQYIEVTGRFDREKQTQALEIVSQLFTRLNIPTNITNKEQWRNFNIAHCVYRMLFTQSEKLPQTDKLAFLSPLNQKQVVDSLVETLQPLIKESKSFWSGQASRYFGRTLLRKLDVENKYTVGGELAVLDAMPVLGMQLEANLTARLIDAGQNTNVQIITSKIINDLNIKINKDDSHKTLAFSIRKAVVQAKSSGRDDETIVEAIKTSLRIYLKAETEETEIGRKWGGLRAVYGMRNTGRLILYTEKLSRQFPVQGHAHGSDFLPFYHLSRLADTIMEAATTQNVQHHHEHEKCCGHHHHDHSEQKRTATNPALHSGHAHRECLRHHHITTTSHQVRPLSVNHDTVHSYNTLRDSLNNTEPLTEAYIRKQQENLDKFRQQAEKFILVSKFKDEQDNTIYVWDNPGYRAQKEYQITYVVNNKTGSMAVKYGQGYLQKSSPIAIVAADADIERGIGVRLLEIGNGQHIALGDRRNSRINVKISGASITDTNLAKENYRRLHSCSLNRGR